MFYHGTSDVFEMNGTILPSTRTGNKREDWRKKDVDKVFFTNSPMSAYKFAKKACVKYGGNPIVYIIKPVGQYYSSVNNEFIADKAKIIGIYER